MLCGRGGRPLPGPQVFFLSLFHFIFYFFFPPPAGVGEGSGAAEFIDRGGCFLAFAGATHDITSAAGGLSPARMFSFSLRIFFLYDLSGLFLLFYTAWKADR